MKTLFLSMALLASVALSAQQQVQPVPDCVIPFTFTAAGNTTVAAGACNKGDNRQTGAVTWTLAYVSSGFSAVTVTLQSAQTTSVPVNGDFATFQGTVVLGSNAMTSTTGAIAYFKNGIVTIPWVRVLFSKTGTGTVTGILQGWTTGPTGGNGTASSGALPGAPDLSVQYRLNASTFGGMTGSAWYNSDLSLVFSSGANPMLIFSANPAGESAGPGSGAMFYTNWNGIVPPNVSGATGTAGAYIEFDAVGGGNTTIVTTGTGGQGGGARLAGAPGGMASAAAVNATGGAGGGGFLIGNAGAAASTGVTSNTGGAGGTASVSSGDGGAATTGAGVNTGGNAGDITIAAGQGGNASDGAMNIGGTAGNVNVYLQAGGTGSTSNGAAGEFRIVGTASANVAKVTRAGRFDLTQDIANYFGLAKITASAVAPGAGIASLHVRAGTNAGTCKVTVNAGTSATEITIVDNIGGAC